MFDTNEKFSINLLAGVIFLGIAFWGLVSGKIDLGSAVPKIVYSSRPKLFVISVIILAVLGMGLTMLAVTHIPK